MINAATGALTELYEAVTGGGLARGPVRIKLAFDELKLAAEVSYPGTPMEFPQRPPGQEEILADPLAQVALAGYLARKYTDTLTVRSDQDVCSISMGFEH